MFFFVKCVFWLAVVFAAMAWQKIESPDAGRPDRAQPKTRDHSAAGRPAPAWGRNDAAPTAARRDVLSGLTEDAAAKLAGAARDACLSHSKDCLLAIGGLEHRPAKPEPGPAP